MSLDELLFPGVAKDNWQMMPCERIALTGVLARLRPTLSLEVGVYHGGSLSLTAQYVQRIIAVDIDPAVTERFVIPANADIRIGDSVDLIPSVLAEVEAHGLDLGFVLIDGDHSAVGVKRDLELVLQHRPTVPMVVIVHDSGNPVCRAGILSVDFAASPYVHSVDLDFVPGQIIEHSVVDGRGEVWGGLCLIYLSPVLRGGLLTVREGAHTTIQALHAATVKV